MFRTINLRDNSLIDAKASFLILKDEVTSEGIKMKRFHELELVRSSVPIFSMSVLFMHTIDERSPLFNLSTESLMNSGCEFFVTIIGVDGTFHQTIHASKVYSVKDLLWNRHFEDIVTVDESGTRHIDFGKFHQLKD